jgi:hypothetical protein
MHDALCSGEEIGACVMGNPRDAHVGTEPPPTQAQFPPQETPAVTLCALSQPQETRLPKSFLPPSSMPHFHALRASNP